MLTNMNDPSSCPMDTKLTHEPFKHVPTMVLRGDVNQLLISGIIP